MAIPGGVKRGKPRSAPKKHSAPAPEVAKTRQTARENTVRHAQRAIQRAAAPKPNLQQNQAARKEGLAPKRLPKPPRYRELPPFRLQDPVTPAAKKKAEGGPRAIKDKKTGAVYFQKRTPTTDEVQRSVARLFAGKNLQEKERGLEQLKRYGLLGKNPGKDFRFEEQPRLKALKPERALDLPGRDRKGRQIYEVEVGGRKFQAVKQGAQLVAPDFGEVHAILKPFAKGGVYAGGKTLGALGDVFHFTGTPGRELADTLGLKGGGAKGAGRLVLEIMGDPSTYLTAGAGAAAKGGSRAAAAAARLERAGVNLTRVKGLNTLVHEAAKTGDARRLADALQSIEKTMTRRGVKKAPTTTQRIARRAIERGRGGKTYLPGAEATESVTQRVAPRIRELRRSGAHLGLVTPTGSKLARGRVLPEASLAVPKVITRHVRTPVISKRKQALVQLAREERARSGAAAKYLPELKAAQQAHRELEDLGVGAPAAELEASRRHITNLKTELSRDVDRALEHVRGLSPRLASLEEKRALKDSSQLAHRAIISSAEIGRVTRASVGKAIDDAIKPLRKEVGPGSDLSQSLARVQFHLWAREAGGGAAREALPALTKTEQKVFDALDGVYRSMRDQGEELGFLRNAVDDYAGSRVFRGRSSLETINELINAGTRATASFQRHRTAPSVFDLASPTRTASELKRAFNIADHDAERLAEELYQRGTVRFHAEKLARRLQRGRTIHIDELSPQELRAVKHWGEYQAARNEPALFRQLDSPETEGRLLLQLNEHPKFEHLAPGTLDDDQKLTDVMHDLADAVRLRNAAHSAGDAKLASEYGDLARKLEIELHDAEQGLGRYANPLEFQQDGWDAYPFAMPGAERALASINPQLADIPGAGGPLTFRVISAPRAGFYAHYLPDEHAIELNAAHLPVDSTAPEDIARVRSSLIHEIAHARTVPEGTFFGEAYRAGATHKYITPARRQASESGGVAMAIARRMRDRAVLEKLGGEEAAAQFRQINSKLLSTMTNGGWSADEARVIREIFNLTNDRTYAAQAREHGGQLLTVLMESTARHMELLARNPEEFRRVVGDEATNWLTEKVLRVQLTDLKPPHLETAKVLMDPKTGALYIAGKDGKLPPRLPPDDSPPFAAGPHEDPFDLRAHDKELFPVLDPRQAGWYRMNAQARLVTLTTRWKGIDRAVGRSMNDDQLVKRGDRWYDPRTKQEFMVPEIAGEPIANIVGQGRLWPTHVVADTQAELARMGELQQEFKVAGQAGIDRVLSQVRWGVTAPFPAYHIRNLISDALKSLQADSGVMFHPISNFKLSMAAFRAGKGRQIKVPGVGEMSVEDFLFFADAAGIRSGEHMADFGRIVGGTEKLDRRTVSRWFHNVQRASISFGSHREDVVRFMTFTQRLRRNGGDAADAAWYMIRHHFDYNDLTAFEKRFARNTFLFYTWYRKNIPLQFVELVRRPGFMAAVSHVYEDLAEGNAPINVDWSKLNPMLPDLTGAVPKVPGLPSYINNQLAAPGLNWNDHAVYLGFGAPWADMGLVSEDALQTWVSMLSPLPLGIPLQLYSGKESLTGRDLNANEPSGYAKAADWIASQIGLSPLPRDHKGRPVLPRALHLALQAFPVVGRAGGSLSSLSETRDQGRLSRYGHAVGSTILGVNTIVEPEVGSERLRKQMKNAVTGLLSDREDYYDVHRNLFPGRDHKKSLDRLMRKYDKEVLLPTAKAQGINPYQLRIAKGWSAGSTTSIYKRKGRKRSGTSGSSFGTNLGGGSFGDSLGGGSLSP